MYPLKEKVSSYLKINDAKFGSRREAGKRLHAGCDLYCPEGTLVYAIGDGVVWEVSKTFYAGTGAISIIHNDRIVRYCEITPTKELKAGMKVGEGCILGTVKRCQGVKQPMLHIEMYTDPKRRDSLTDLNRLPFKRRNDVFDPTKWLESLEVKNVEAD